MITLNPHLLSPVRPKRERRDSIVRLKRMFADGHRFLLCQDIEVVKVGKYRYTYDDGHQRIIAAKELSMAIPVIIIRDLYYEFQYLEETRKNRLVVSGLMPF